MCICLNDGWRLKQHELYYDSSFIHQVSDGSEGWLDAGTLPCDIHQPLIRHGAIGDPVIAKNDVSCLWVESKSWWFKKTFMITEEILNADICILSAEGLDCEADLFLNETKIGRQRSQTYPFIKDVRHWLCTGENELIIRVTSGLEHYGESDFNGFAPMVHMESSRRGDRRRIFVRKPAYVYGWDWNPRIPTIGITGNVWIEAVNEIKIRTARFAALELRENEADILVETVLNSVLPYGTPDVELEISLSLRGAEVLIHREEMMLHAGENYLKRGFTIQNPELWWPNGMGGQTMYDLRCTVRTKKNNTSQYETKVGIRTVKVDTSKINDKERLFCFVVNGKRMFGKGGNWETPDSIYARISDEKYDVLVREAKEANFNMFRFNGCDAYERDYFYECCDKYGIMLWHDFAFSIAAYPDERDWFRHECANEIEYQITRVRNHPCLAMWCGTNESQWSMMNFFNEEQRHYISAGYYLYNVLMPKLIHTLSPEIFYWNGSPLGGDGYAEPNGPERGNRHEWHAAFIHTDINKRIIPEMYDTICGKFISEFGCIGPAKKSSVRKYCGTDEIDVNSDMWLHHSNTFAEGVSKGTMQAAITKFYADADTVTTDEYLLYGGLFQGIMLGHAFESMRITPNNNGALMWSYNDCWTEQGWGIIDYYTTRKIAYHFVRRALAHVRFMIRRAEGGLKIFLANDTLSDVWIPAEYGYTSFDGITKDVSTAEFQMSAVSTGAVLTIDHDYDFKNGVFFVKPLADGLLPAVYKPHTPRELGLRPIMMDMEQKRGGEFSFTVSSDVFLHAVHFNFPDSVLLSDEYFDLLPGEKRVIIVNGKKSSNNS